MVESIKLKNTVTNKEIIFDNKNSPFVLQSAKWGAIESNRQSYKYLNQVGVYVTGVTLETRDIEIVGWVVGKVNSELKLKKNVLNQFINPTQLIEATVNNYKIKFFSDTTIKYATDEKQNNEVMCKFMITGFCPDPMFVETFENRVDGASTLPKFKFPLIIPQSKGIIMGLRQPSLFISIDNGGAVPVGMRIEFLAQGTVKNPSLVNVNTQEFFKVNKTMTAGEKIIIITHDGEKRIIGEKSGLQTNYYQYRDLSSIWLKLDLGTNLFRYDAEENIESLEVYIYFNNKYLEVE